jgi:hypothetical protein
MPVDLNSFRIDETAIDVSISSISLARKFPVCELHVVCVKARLRPILTILAALSLTTANTSLFRRPYTKATIFNMLPATFFSNVADHY